MTLKSGEKYQIQAESDYPLAYKSEDIYIATVNYEGKLETVRIGKTHIVITSAYDEVKLNLNIEAKYNIYPEPDMEWGISIKEFISKYGEPDEIIYEEEEGVLIYTDLSYNNYAEKCPNIIYSFNEKNELYYIALITEIGEENQNIHLEELEGFLNERYFFSADNSQDDRLFFLNAPGFENTTYLVGMYIFYENQAIITYQPLIWSSYSSAPVYTKFPKR